jgi:hypothetical protein
MDALTFGGEVLLRHLTFSEARKMVFLFGNSTYLIIDLSIKKIIF